MESKKERWELKKKGGGREGEKETSFLLSATFWFPYFLDPCFLLSYSSLFSFCPSLLFSLTLYLAMALFQKKNTDPLLTFQHPRRINLHHPLLLQHPLSHLLFPGQIHPRLQREANPCPKKEEEKREVELVSWEVEDSHCPEFVSERTRRNGGAKRK